MELLDIYDDDGNTTGRTIIRGDKSVELSKHEHIAVAVIFIKNSSGEFLIQKTSKEKGGYFSSTGGHINSGETPLETIQREVEEELGIKIPKEEIQELGFIREGMPLRFLFYIEIDIPLEAITLQQEEVESVEYKKKEEIEQLIKNKELLESHGILFKELLKRIQ